MLSPERLAKAVADLQQYSVTKRVFRAEADDKCIIVYGKATCGEEKILQNNTVLLNAYVKKVYNFDDLSEIKRFVEHATTALIYAEAHYSGNRKINFPLKNLIEIFMQ